jgi:hypothetical protein
MSDYRISSTRVRGGQQYVFIRVGGESIHGVGDTLEEAERNAVVTAEASGAFLRAEIRKAEEEAYLADKEAQEATVTPLDHLKAQAGAIEISCSGWKSCKDGSYEMALANYKYYDILEQIKQLEANEGE